MRGTISVLLLGVALTANAQQSFFDRYECYTDNEDSTVTIMGVKPGVTLSGDLVIPGTVTDPSSGKKYKVISLDYSYNRSGPLRGTFYGQSEITSVYIPSTIESICYGAFTGCRKIKEFKVSSANKKYKTIDGALYRDRESDIDLLRFPPARTSSGFTLPAEVSGIIEEAFADNYTVTTLRLSGWQMLYNEALKGNLGITRFELTDSHIYTTDGNFLFSESEGKTAIVAVAPRYCMDGQLTIPSSVEVIKSLAGSRAAGVRIHSGVSEIWGMAFTGTSFRSVTVPSGVTSLNTYRLFADSPSLESVAIECPCPALDEEAFSCCTSLREVNLPSSCKSLGQQCFYGCKSLKTMNGLYRFTDLSEEGGQFSCSGLKSVNIPSVWKKIPKYMFAGCDSLASVTINDGVEEIGSHAFHNTALETINTRTVRRMGYNAVSPAGGSMRKVIIPAQEYPMELSVSAFSLNDGFDLYIDRKEMGGESWPYGISWPYRCGVRIFTSKRSFTHFFQEWEECYVPYGSRVHYRSKTPLYSAQESVYEMFGISDIKTSAPSLTVHPEFWWVKITGVTINGKAAVNDGETWSAAVKGSDPMNVVVSYTANDVKMSTEYNLSEGAVSVDLPEAASGERSARLTVYRKASAEEGRRYLDLQGRPCVPEEGRLCIEIVN